MNERELRRMADTLSADTEEEVFARAAGEFTMRFRIYSTRGLVIVSDLNTALAKWRAHWKALNLLAKSSKDEALLLSLRGSLIGGIELQCRPVAALRDMASRALPLPVREGELEPWFVEDEP